MPLYAKSNSYCPANKKTNVSPLYQVENSTTDCNYRFITQSFKCYNLMELIQNINSSNKPEINFPDCNKPNIEIPSTETPDTDKPGTETPDTDKPSTEIPDTDKPSTETPDTDKPSTETPDTDKPSTETPDTDKPSTETPAPSPDVNVSSQTAFENKVLELVNVERAKQGLKALTMDESVRKVARAKSTDMSQKNYFSHTSPTYGSPFDMLKSFGISYKSAGENIAQGYPTPEAVVTGWMNSPGHRANILNASYTHIGVGYEANGKYWTQLFIGK
ncbi:serine protease [Sporanaerobium hydrogeniformans]|uniref:Serine protease n=2 Tax=Sporanaerobium hydrogeniformans TaxID=3072179 RepID=A0AC61D6C9_9FIRM|nr:serine protease [Sporanaerobium hydrogeniformans]